MSTSTSKPKVLITGVSGYLGSFICQTFLEHGGFDVWGTVRDKSNESKIKPLRVEYGNDLVFSRLDLVEADLLNEDSILAAAEGCDYIVHTASPVCDLNAVFENEEDVIKPAVGGTLAIMKAAHKNKVKKVVITSSIAAIVGGNEGSGKSLTEEDWTDINKRD
jgi:dihydroflavonol-4-reductase